MRFVRHLAAGLLAASPPAVALAAPPSPLDLVRGLRDNGLADLAVERLDDLAKSTTLAPADAKIVPIESARTKLAMAAAEANEGRRTQMLSEAGKAFDEFLKNDKDHPLAAQIAVERARLESMAAKAELNKARRVEDKESRAAEFGKARPFFTRAAGLYADASKQLDARIKALPPADPTRKELERDQLQARLDNLVTQYEMALTFADKSEEQKQVELIDKLKDQFDSLARVDIKNPVCLIALVWWLECRIQTDDKVANKELDQFVATNGINAAAAPAVRLAKRLKIDHVWYKAADKAATEQVRAKLTADTAEAWLRDYPRFQATPDGVFARYRLARMREIMAQPGIKFNDKGRIASVSPGAEDYLEKAAEDYRKVAETDNDFTDRAERNRSTILLTIADGKGKGADPDPKALDTFSVAFVAAQLQEARLARGEAVMRAEADKTIKAEQEALAKIEATEKDEKKLADARQAAAKRIADAEKSVGGEKAVRGENARKYLERAFELQTPKDSPRDATKARLLYARLLLSQRMPYQAAVLAESVAQANRKSSQGAAAGVLALHSYNAALERSKGAGEGDKASEAADLERIKGMCRTIETNWPAEPAADEARYFLGFYLAREGNPTEAWNAYSRISANYPLFYDSRVRMAAVAYKLVRGTEAEPDALRKGIEKRKGEFATVWGRTLDALENLTPPGATAPPGDAEGFVRARLQLAQLYQLGRDFDKVQEAAQKIGEALATFKNVPDKAKEELGYSAKALRNQGVHGKAVELVRAGKFKEANDVVAPEIPKIKEEVEKAAPEAAGKSFDSFRDAQRRILSLALRVSVQTNDIDEATKRLDVLQASGGAEGNLATLRQVVKDIRGQVEGLREAKQTKEADEMATSFGKFLDKLAGDTEKTPSNMLAFLAAGYSGIDQNDKAADLYTKILEKKDVKDNQPLTKQMTLYLARAYRHVGTKKAFDEADKLMKEMVGNPLDKAAKQGWGFKSLEVRKEYCHLQEAKKLDGVAVANWTAMTNQFAAPLPAMPLEANPKRAEILAKRALYFDLYFEAKRASAQAWARIDMKKTKLTPTEIEEKQAKIGEDFYKFLTDNADIPEDIQVKIDELLEDKEKKYGGKIMKKKFDELKAAAKKKK